MLKGGPGDRAALFDWFVFGLLETIWAYHEPMTIAIGEFRQRLEELLKAAANGEEVVVALGEGQEVRLVPNPRPQGRRVFGSGKGQVWIAEDFNETPEDFGAYL